MAQRRSMLARFRRHGYTVFCSNISRSIAGYLCGLIGYRDDRIQSARSKFKAATRQNVVH
jgi:hypothetical protein